MKRKALLKTGCSLFLTAGLILYPAENGFSHSVMADTTHFSDGSIQIKEAPEKKLLFYQGALYQEPKFDQLWDTEEKRQKRKGDFVGRVSHVLLSIEEIEEDGFSGYNIPAGSSVFEMNGLDMRSDAIYLIEPPTGESYVLEKSGLMENTDTMTLREAIRQYVDPPETLSSGNGWSVGLEITGINLYTGEDSYDFYKITGPVIVTELNTVMDSENLGPASGEQGLPAVFYGTNPRLGQIPAIFHPEENTVDVLGLSFGLPEGLGEKLGQIAAGTARSYYDEANLHGVYAVQSLSACLHYPKESLSDYSIEAVEFTRPDNSSILLELEQAKSSLESLLYRTFEKYRFEEMQAVSYRAESVPLWGTIRIFRPGAEDEIRFYADSEILRYISVNGVNFSVEPVPFSVSQLSEGLNRIFM